MYLEISLLSFVGIDSCLILPFYHNIILWIAIIDGEKTFFLLWHYRVLCWFFLTRKARRGLLKQVEVNTVVSA